MIRHATPADTPRLIEMATRFLLETSYGEMFDNAATPATIGELIGNVLALGVILVAEMDEAQLSYAGRAPFIGGDPPTGRDSPIVGMLAIVVVPHPLTGRNYAEEIVWWVEPEHRGSTLGPKMLRCAEEWARQKCANMVKLVAPDGSTVGRFLEAVGYTKVEAAYIKTI